MNVRRRLFVFLGVCALAAAPALAWHVEGHVYCDVNQNGVFDEEDTPYEGALVRIHVLDTDAWVSDPVTDATGWYSGGLHEYAETYRMWLDPAFLPPDATVVQPPGGEYLLDIGDTWSGAPVRDFLFDSEICHTQAGACWMTGGGVKFEPIVDMLLATHGPKDSLGGNVNPSCSPEPGDGGNWNHIAHRLKLHFQGQSIRVVRCGNVPGIDPGSESPVTPYNFIEFRGSGRLTGIAGNKLSLDLVYFFGRVEDRNEPGNENASDGEDIDRYFLHVFSDPGNPVGTTLMLIDVDGDPATVDPITITGGNLQLHASSCDD